MQDCRLVIFEGLMGSGKSTMATQTALALQKRKIPYRYHWESEMPHPVKTRARKGEGVFSAEEQIENSLAKWSAFVAHAQKAKRVTIFDGQLFHVNVTNVLKANGSHDQVKAYICQLVQIIQPLKPRLVYFYQEDVAKALQKVGKQRGQEWLEKMARDKNESEFGKANGLEGVSGLVTFCEMFCALTRELTDSLDMHTLAIENSEGDWANYEKQIFEFLALGGHDASLKLSNEHLTQGQAPVPARLCVDNQTGRLLVVYRLGYKKVSEDYAFEVLPNGQMWHDTQLGRRIRIRDVNTGEAVKDVIVCEAEHIVKIEDPV